MNRLTLFILMLAIVLPAAAQAETYTWTKPDGSLGVTNDPGQVPEQYREQAIRNAQTGNGGVSQGNYQKEYPEAAQDAGSTAAKPLTDEERKKTEKDIKEVWENLKKVFGEEQKN